MKIRLAVCLAALLCPQAVFAAGKQSVTYPQNSAQQPSTPQQPQAEALRFGPDTKGIFSISFENDIFSGTDNHYTNGVRLAYVPGENQAPDWLEENIGLLFPAAGHKRWSFSVGQSMFTPSDISKSVPDPRDRPYAGWLYGTIGVVSDTGLELDNLQLTLGVVGPAALGGETQDFVHRVVGIDRPKGWSYQLHNEPGVILSYEHKWRGLYQFSPFGWAVDLTPSLGASVGNIYTYANAGAMVRFGYDLPSDYGPPLIRPSMPGSDFFVPTKEFGWYFFAGVEGRAVARNIFLDGNTFRDSPNVDKFPLVASFQGGLAFTIGDTRLAYTHVLRTREFHGQPRNDSFGAFTVSQRF